LKTCADDGLLDSKQHFELYQAKITAKIASLFLSLSLSPETNIHYAKTWFLQIVLIFTIVELNPSLMPCVAYMTSHGYLVLAKYRCSDERMQKRFSDESVVVYQAR